MRTSSAQRGELKIGTILFLAIVFYGIFLALRLVPVWADDKNVFGEASEVVKYAQTRLLRSDKEVRGAVWQSIKDYIDIPEEEIEVKDEGQEWHVHFEWKRDVPLIFWRYQKDHVFDERGPK